MRAEQYWTFKVADEALDRALYDLSQGRRTARVEPSYSEPRCRVLFWKFFCFVLDGDKVVTCYPIGEHNLPMKKLEKILDAAAPSR